MTIDVLNSIPIFFCIPILCILLADIRKTSLPLLYIAFLFTFIIFDPGTVNYVICPLFVSCLIYNKYQKKHILIVSLSVACFYLYFMYTIQQPYFHIYKYLIVGALPLIALINFIFEKKIDYILAVTIGLYVLFWYNFEMSLAQLSLLIYLILRNKFNFRNSLICHIFNSALFTSIISTLLVIYRRNTNERG
jgi:hypothetical protein